MSLQTARLLFHVHTRFSSDGVMTPEGAVRFCARKGIEMLAICDHDSTEAVGQAVRAGNRFGVRVLPAREYATDAGDLVGLLACPEPTGREFCSVVDSIRNAEGVTALVHPGHNHRLAKISAGDVDIVECFNARCTKAENDVGRELACVWSKPVLAGTDAHLPWELKLAVNVFRVPARWDAMQARPDEIRQMLLNADRRLIEDTSHPASVGVSQAIKGIRSGRPLLAARASLFACRRLAGVVTTRRGSRS
jgi:hypothetical protein